MAQQERWRPEEVKSFEKVGEAGYQDHQGQAWRAIQGQLQGTTGDHKGPLRDKWGGDDAFLGGPRGPRAGLPTWTLDLGLTRP
jgi:hypothetical protein